MPNIDIFISYRRHDSVYLANLIYFKLTEEGYRVFLDTESLSGGYFSDDIQSVIKQCKDFILVLPPDGLSRCNDASDILRLEVELALKCNKRIIPILMPGFEYPDNPPDSLSMLPLLNEVRIDENKLQADIGRILKFLSSEPYKPIDELSSLLRFLVEKTNASSQKEEAERNLCTANEYGTPQLNAYDKKNLKMINQKLDDKQPQKPELQGISDIGAYFERKKVHKLKSNAYPAYRDRIISKYYDDHKLQREQLRKQDYAEQQILLAEAQNKLDEADERLTKAKNAVHACNIVNSDLKNEEAVKMLIAYLKEGRAKSLREAIWLYDEHAQKKQELYLMRETIFQIRSLEERIAGIRRDYHDFERKIEESLYKIDRKIDSIDRR